MSDENKTPNLQSWIEPGLEARVVAWVLGEASEFEAAELSRIVAETPELAIFKRRIAAVHDLVGAATRLELDPMRMDAERRKKLLEKLGSAPAAGGAPVLAMPWERKPGGWKSIRRTVVGIAACLLIVLVLASISMPAFTSVQKKAALSKDLQQRQAEMAQAEQKLAAARQEESIASPDHDGANVVHMPSGITAMNNARPVLGDKPVVGSLFSTKSITLPAPTPLQRFAALDALKEAGREQDYDPGTDGAGKFGARFNLGSQQTKAVVNLDANPVRLSGQNTYTGKLSVSAGNLSIPADAFLRAGPAHSAAFAQAKSSQAQADAATEADEKLMARTRPVLPASAVDAPQAAQARQATTEQAGVAVAQEAAARNMTEAEDRSELAKEASFAPRLWHQNRLKCALTVPEQPEALLRRRRPPRHNPPRRRFPFPPPLLL